MELSTILQDQGVSEDGKRQLVEAFGGPFNEVGEVLANYQEIKVTDVSQVDEMAKAREQRLLLKNARTTVEHKRKELKEGILKTGRAIDAVANFVKESIAPAEQYLKLQEDFKKLKDEADRAERLAKRADEITKRGGDPSLYNLGDFSNERFEQLLVEIEQAQAAKKAAELEAEKKRIAEEKAEQERQAEMLRENERLKKEAAEREAELEKARAKAAEEAEKKRKELEQEQEKRRQLEQAEAERRAAIEQAEIAKREIERQMLLAPDKQKIKAIIPRITEICDSLPATKQPRAQALVKVIDAMLNKAIKFIDDKVEGL